MTIHKKSQRTNEAAARRLHRVPPLRVEPLRDWPGALRNPASPKTKNGDSPEKTPARVATGGFGFDGITQGYRLIEEHIRRSRAAAILPENGRRQSKADANEDVQAVVAQIVRSLSELLPIVGDLFNRLGADGIARILTGMARPSRAESTNGIAEAGARVRIELSSSRPATANLELRTGAEKLRLVAHPLVPANPRSGALKTLRFSRAKRGAAPSLSIRIPAHQPPGIYTGAVVDERSGAAQGVLTIQIR